jgi:hypothetical protein
MQRRRIGGTSSDLLAEYIFILFSFPFGISCKELANSPEIALPRRSLRRGLLVSSLLAAG